MLPCIYGSATLAIVESSVCISIARMADAVIRPRCRTLIVSDMAQSVGPRPRCALAPTARSLAGEIKRHAARTGCRGIRRAGSGTGKVPFFLDVWLFAQCASFAGTPHVAATAASARRNLPHRGSFLRLVTIAAIWCGMSERHHTRVLIIGAGPAGYTAAIYAARANMNPILVAGMQPGGQLTITTDVENYPGFADVIQGPWLMEQMEAQARHVGTVIQHDIITEVDFSHRPFRCLGDSGDTYTADAVIIATGAQARWLGLEFGGSVAGPRRLGLRHLRRVLLPRQDRRGDRRRQHGGRGSAVSDPSRGQGDAGAPARLAARGGDPAGAAVRQPEDLRRLEQGGQGDPRRRLARGGDRRAADRHEDRRRQRHRRWTACSSPSAIRRTPRCSAVM